MTRDQMIMALSKSKDEIVAEKCKDLLSGKLSIEQAKKEAGVFMTCVLNGDYNEALAHADHYKKLALFIHKDLIEFGFSKGGAEKDFVPYELSLELKKIGFKERCLGYYDQDDNQILKFDYECTMNSIPAPTFYQAFKWFDENTNLKGFIVPSFVRGHFDWVILENDEKRNQNEVEFVERHESQQQCLEYMISITLYKMALMPNILD
jgi:hypothetical protein